MDISTNQRDKLLLFFCLTIIFAGSITKLYTNDAWWHLAEGKYNLTNGAVLDKEIFSYTVKGDPRYNAYWFCQILFYLLYIIGGLNLAIVFKAVIVVLSYYMLIKVINLGEKTRPAFWMFAVILMLYLGTRGRFIVRPLIFMFLFLISYYYILLLYRENKRNFLPLLVGLQLIWSGTHASVFYGQMLVGLFVVEAWLRFIFHRHDPESALPHRQQAKTLSIYFAVLLVTLLINPYHYLIYLSPLLHLKTFKTFTFVAEMLPFDWKQSSLYHFFGVLLALISLYSLLKKRRYAEILFLLFLGISSFRYFRFVGIFLFMVTPISLREIRTFSLLSFIDKLFSNRTLKTVVYSILAVCLVGLVMWDFTYKPTRRQLGLGVTPQRFPKAAVEFIKANIPKKRGLTRYDWGGYFIWRLYPDQEVFIDGRCLPFLKIYNEFFSVFLSPENFHKVAEKYQIDYVYLKNICYGVDEREQQYLPPDKWRLIFFDSLGALYLKVTPANQSIIDQFGYRFLRPFYPHFDYLPPLYKGNQKIIDEEISRGIATDPTNPVPYLMRAFVAFAKKDFTQAREDFLKIIELDPKNAIAYFNIANYYRSRNQHKKAREAYIKVIKLDNSYILVAESYMYLGITLIKANNIPAAVNSLRQSVFLLDNNMRANFYLGLALHLNKESEAEHYLKLVKNNLQNASPAERGEINQLVQTYKVPFF